MVSIGQAAHKNSAGKNGPRTQGDLTPEQLKAYENGIHLCNNCAKFIDRLEELYPVERLHKIQAQAVSDAFNGFIKLNREGYELNTENSIKLTEFIKLVNDCIWTFQIHTEQGYWDVHWPIKSVQKAYDIWRLLVNIQMRTNQYNTGSFPITKMQYEVAASLLELAKSVEQIPWIISNHLFENKYFLQPPIYSNTHNASILAAEKSKAYLEYIRGLLASLDTNLRVQGISSSY